MIETASKELSKLLFDLSGWNEVPFTWHLKNNGWVVAKTFDVTSLETSYPAYDLGFLLRKLPPYIENDGFELNLSLEFDADGKVTAEYRQYKYNGKVVYVYNSKYHNTADTPEDAACKLAITLFEQKIIKADHD